MITEILGTCYLLLPLLGGAALHGVCMKYQWLAPLARPIDGGRRVGGRPLFGRSKTWRGPILVAAGAAGVYALQRGPLHGIEAIASIELVDYARLPGWWFGALVGAAAELSELPNSFVKRRLDIEPGGTTKGLPSAFFYLWDQLDVLLGFWLVWAVEVPVTPLRLGVSVLLVGTLHPILTVVAYGIGMRPTAR